MNVVLPAGAHITSVKYTAVGQYTITFTPTKRSILDSQRLLSAMSLDIQALSSILKQMYSPSRVRSVGYGRRWWEQECDMTVCQRALAEMWRRSPGLSIDSGVDAYNVWFEVENLEIGESASFAVQFYGYEDYRPLTRNEHNDASTGRQKARALRVPTEAEISTYDFIHGTRAKIVSDPEILRKEILATWRWFRKEVRRLNTPCEAAPLT